MKRAALVGQAIVFAGLLSGCAAPPPESDRLAESIVLTRHAPDADFSQLKTYYLRPEIMTVSDDGEPTPIADNQAAPLLNTISKNMNERGFVAVDDKLDADLAVEMVYVEHVSSAYWCYYWWDPYYWGYPYWGYYPYYPCDVSVWKSGMLSTMMTDLTPARDNPGGGGDAGGGEAGAGGAGGRPDILSGIWFSGIYAVSPTTSGAVDGINQSFKQSSYIKAGN